MGTLFFVRKRAVEGSEERLRENRIQIEGEVNEYDDQYFHLLIKDKDEVLCDAVPQICLQEFIWREK